MYGITCFALPCLASLEPSSAGIWPILNLDGDSGDLGPKENGSDTYRPVERHHSSSRGVASFANVDLQ